MIDIGNMSSKTGLEKRRLVLFPRVMSQVPCLHEHLTNAARVKYQCVLWTHSALLRIKLDTPSACCGVFDCAAFGINGMTQYLYYALDENGFYGGA